MHMSIFFTLSALLSASLTSAQEVLAEVMIYGAEDCGKDPNNPDLVSQSITVFKDVSEIKVVDGKPQGGCMSAMSEVPDWPTNSQGQYLLSVDENTIPKDCSLVVYTDLPDDAESGPGVCGIFYRRVPSDGTCTSFNIKPHFGYAMCCGQEACAVAQKDDPFSSPSKRETSSASVVRDVTAVKRASPFHRLHKRDCGFELSGDDKSTTVKYGDQRKITNEVICEADVDCTDGVEISYSESVTNTFGVEASLGGELFKALSLSVSFTYEYSIEKGTEFTGKYDGARPKGSRGYITFTPKIECAPKGTLTGDNCNVKDKATTKEGEACFPVFLENKPDGIFTFVQTN